MNTYDKNNDRFLVGILDTLNSVYKKFRLIKKKGNIYIVGYDKATFSGEIPSEGGDVDIIYPEKDIIIIDKDCVVPFTKEHMEKTGGWKEIHNDKEWLRGHTAGCNICHQYNIEARKRGLL